MRSCSQKTLSAFKHNPSRTKNCAWLTKEKNDVTEPQGQKPGEEKAWEEVEVLLGLYPSQSSSSQDKSWPCSASQGEEGEQDLALESRRSNSIPVVTPMLSGFDSRRKLWS